MFFIFQTEDILKTPVSNDYLIVDLLSTNLILSYVFLISTEWKCMDNRRQVKGVPLLLETKIFDVLVLHYFISIPRNSTESNLC